MEKSPLPEKQFEAPQEQKEQNNAFEKPWLAWNLENIGNLFDELIEKGQATKAAKDRYIDMWLGRKEKDWEEFDEWDSKLYELSKTQNQNHK